MKVSGGILLASASALAISVASFQARAADMPVKAPVVEEEGIDYHGAAEFGWDYFIKRPPNAAGACTVTSVANPAAKNPNGVNPTGIFCPGGFATGGDTRAKFEEYGRIPNGPTFDFATVSVATKNGLYFADAWAQNVGRNNQSYLLDVGKAGVAYFEGGYDQTPHLYSTSAVSIWGGSPAALTTPFNFGINPASTFATQNAINNAILAGGVITSVVMRRDTAYGSFRDMQKPESDFRFEFSGTRRVGTLLLWVIIEQGFG
jgi:hypothetical protein